MEVTQTIDYTQFIAYETDHPTNKNIEIHTLNFHTNVKTPEIQKQNIYQ